MNLKFLYCSPKRKELRIYIIMHLWLFLLHEIQHKSKFCNNRYQAKLVMMSDHQC